MRKHPSSAYVKCRYRTILYYKTLLENEILTDDEIFNDLILEYAKETNGKDDNYIEEDDNPIKTKDIDATKTFETAKSYTKNKIHIH